MSLIINKLNEGGPFFTYPMLVMLGVMIWMFIRGMLKEECRTKMISLLESLGWFSVAWAFMGHTIGLITAFDSIGAAGDLAPKYLAEGLKIALLNLMGGAIMLFVARLSMIILIWKRKD